MSLQTSKIGLRSAHGCSAARRSAASLFTKLLLHTREPSRFFSAAAYRPYACPGAVHHLARRACDQLPYPWKYSHIAPQTRACHNAPLDPLGFHDLEVYATTATSCKSICVDRFSMKGPVSTFSFSRIRQSQTQSIASIFHCRGNSDRLASTISYP